jgi:hypothetical protein
MGKVVLAGGMNIYVVRIQIWINGHDYRIVDLEMKKYFISFIGKTCCDIGVTHVIVMYFVGLSN